MKTDPSVQCARGRANWQARSIGRSLQPTTPDPPRAAQLSRPRHRRGDHRRTTAARTQWPATSPFRRSACRLDRAGPHARLLIATSPTAAHHHNQHSLTESLHAVGGKPRRPRPPRPPRRRGRSGGPCRSWPAHYDFTSIIRYSP
jgi:hypothetical protein